MSLILGKTEKVGIKTAEGVVSERFYPIKAIADIPGAVKDAFLEHKYNLSDLAGSFIKIFTYNERELGELMNILDEIDALDLKEVFNANLIKILYFKRKFLERVKYCVNNDIPFLNQDNSFASFLENEEVFAEYTSKGNSIREESNFSNRAEDNSSKENCKTTSIPANISKVDSFGGNPNNNIFPALDGEDAKVYNEIRNTLEQIKEVKQDGSIKFIIDSALSNLGDIIIRDNKQYRDAGIGSLVRKATKGVALTPEMETIINEEILVAFPDNNVGRGIKA